MNPVINLTNISAFVAIILGSAWVFTHNGYHDGLLFLAATTFAYILIAMIEYEIEKSLEYHRR